VLSNSIDVDQPPDTTFAYVTDPGHFADWQKGVTSGHMDEPGPVTLGSRCLTVRRIGFAERPIAAVVTSVDPPHTWSVRGTDGPIRSEVTVTVDPLDGGRRSRVTIELEFTGHGIGTILVPLFVRPQARAEMRSNMQQLKQRLEHAQERKRG
jgi:uncharacterized protein YndB with AHSA1/START domain